MNFLANIGDWFVDTLLKPVLGEWWAEITFCIVFALICALVVFTIIISVKYFKLKRGERL